MGTALAPASVATLSWGSEHHVLAYNPLRAGRERLVGPARAAQLTAAFELSRLGREGVVFEADDQVGGISRTVAWGKCRRTSRNFRVGSG